MDRKPNKRTMKKIISRSPFTLQRWGILIACNLLNLTLISSAIAQPESFRTLIVTGKGTESISTTIARVQLGVEIRSETAAQVQQEIAAKTSAIVELLRSQDVKQLQTTGVRLNPNYAPSDRNENQTVITGYTGTNIVSFETSIEQVGDLLDEAVAAGASRVDNISFTATPAAISEAKEEALRKASINAQEQAEVVLETLDLEAKEIVNIKVDRANVDRPQPFNANQFGRAESRASTPIIGGEQEVNANVTLQISY